MRTGLTRLAIAGRRVAARAGPLLRAGLRRGKAAAHFSAQQARAAWAWWLAWLLARAVNAGATVAQVDRTAAWCRAGMWAVAALMLILWAAFGWLAAALPAFLAVTLGGAAAAHWQIAVELEKRERASWP